MSASYSRIIVRDQTRRAAEQRALNSVDAFMYGKRFRSWTDHLACLDVVLERALHHAVQP